MRSSQVARAILVPVFMAVLLAGCGAASAASASGEGGTQCGGGHHVEVVVEFEGKKVDRSCVSFKGSEIPAETAIKRGNIEYATKHFSRRGRRLPGRQRTLVVGHGDPVLAGIDLCCLRSEVLAITGANGSGKTTLLRTLAGLFPPLSGQLQRQPGCRA